MAKCPYCEEQMRLDSADRDEADEVRKDVEGLVKKGVTYSCPHRDRALGFAFFFGGIAMGRP